MDMHDSKRPAGPGRLRSGALLSKAVLKRGYGARPTDFTPMHKREMRRRPKIAPHQQRRVAERAVNAVNAARFSGRARSCARQAASI